MIQFDLPKEQSSILKVIGVGGGGGNAVNHMFNQNIDGVNFIICNTDAQAISNSEIPNKIQLGPQLTSGLGAGANPEIGRQATIESLEEIRKILEVNTKMAFITAGMGGGTGTGGAPIIAKICKDLGVLTVGIVTTPFAYEGKKRQQQADEGINQLRQYVDTLLVISNDKLRHQYGNLKMREAFEKADNVLATAAKCITDVINSTGQINVDFADVCTVMKNGGRAILGNAAASGEDRAQHAIEEALNSPLLNDNDIKGAKWILININSAEGEHEFTMDEVEVVQSYLLSHAGDDTDVILGLGYDSTLGDKIGITLIATGFENKDPFVKPLLKKEEVAEGKIVMTLNELNSSVIKPQSAVTPSAVPEPKAIDVTPTPVVDMMAPRMVDDDIYFMSVPMPKIEDVVNESDEAPFFIGSLTSNANSGSNELNTSNLSIVPDKVENAFYSPSVPGDRILEQTDIVKINPLTEVPQAPSTQDTAVKSFLSKPVNIYAESSDVSAANASATEELNTTANQMKLAVFEKGNLLESERNDEPTINQLTKDYEEQEMQKQRNMERIQKLRNLSFNINSNDPSEELEQVPAYVRRNMELRNNTSHIETYYSKFEISTDEQNQGQINTINTFLEGNKPD